MSYGLWKRRLGADANIVGKMVRIDAHPFMVVGIGPDGFKGTDLRDPVDVWIPLTMLTGIESGLARSLSVRDASWLKVIGRLKPGVSPRQAEAEMDMLARRLEREYPIENKGVGVKLDSHIGLWPDERAEATSFSGLMMASVGLVLLIACANVANLFLAKATTRQKEMAVRLAIGANRARLIRLLLAESVLLGLAAGGVALLLSSWVIDLLSSSSTMSGFLRTFAIEPDGRVLAFTAAVSLVTSALFGLAPALQGSKPNLVPALKEGTSVHRFRPPYLRNFLVVSQIAISLLLLVGASLLVRTLRNYEVINPGFEVRNVLDISLGVGQEGYPEAQGRLFYRRVLEEVQNLPGVRSASLALNEPISGSGYGTCIQIEGHMPPAGDLPCIPVDFTIVSPDYFQTLGISIIVGRGFSDKDVPQEPPVAVINRTMAQRLWPGENPIGKRVSRWTRAGLGPWIQVVGVTQDVKYRALVENPRHMLYLPLTQNYQQTMTLMVRASGNPMSLLPVLRSKIQSVDKNVPLVNVRTLAEHVEASLVQQKIAASLIGFSGVLALLLASVGLYSVVSCAVSQRTHEIGIRMALGAERSDVLKLVVGQGSVLTLIGVGIGVAGAMGLTRFLRSLLFGIRPTDPETFAVVVIILIAVATLASYIPARRATKVDPIVALRYE